MILSAAQREALSGADCEVAFDALTRALYATDASLYQIEPAAVAFPRNAQQASSIISRAADASVPIIPRGAGTGLVGGALGEGIVVEFSRFNRSISDLNIDAQSVRVGAGVVLDQLNAFLKPHGCCFGPDVATSSRATIGGMIANNSSGSHVPVYGTTADHVLSLDLVMADGRIETVGRRQAGLQQEQAQIVQLIEKHGPEIAARMPAGLMKRWPGYGLDRALRSPGHLADILAGSEGTLAAIASAELKISPLPKTKGLALIFFASVTEAMQATVELLDLQPAAIEHIDHVLFDQTKGQLAFQAARDFLELDAKPCKSILVVEFFESVPEKLSLLAERSIGMRKTLVASPEEMALVWGLRKAGLSLLTSRKGAAKPLTGIEDTAVRPEQLPEYVASLQSILKPLAAETCFYGHAATGLLHVRPVLDVHNADELGKFRTIAREVSALVKQFKGSIAAEHGVGMARTEFMREHLGDEVLRVMRDMKAIFDPRDLMNPGKIFDGKVFRIDERLRPDLYTTPLPFRPVLAFAARDKSFIANLDQCNGCGGCRKDPPTMCPTFVATGEESMSTRGRANLIRAALQLRGSENGDVLASDELDLALSNCLSCKACTTECPSNVNMALLKAELLYARQRKHGRTLRTRMIGAADALGRFGCSAPSLANATLDSSWFRELLRRGCGITQRRPLPRYATERFDHWFHKHPRSTRGSRGQVVLWDDTFVRYHEPHIGKAAVAVLEAAGFEVALAEGRGCCGRPAFSQGHLETAAGLGNHNLNLLSQRYADVPVVFLEPSCYSMFVEDYGELRLAAKEIASRSFLFEQFIEQMLAREPEALTLERLKCNIAVHAHCHAKSLLNVGFMSKVAQRATAASASLLDTGCCGMAGAFGMLDEKYDLSVKVAQPLLRAIERQPADSIIVASGTSCRHQIEHLSTARPRHMAEVLAEALVSQTHLTNT
jgi:FAD/FMN-containing dehydrogenase/Fe-S oxidoreductase